MRKVSFVAVALSSLVLSLALSTRGSWSASSTSGGHVAAAASFTVGLVTDIGGLNDKSFNADAYNGLRMAEAAFPGVKGNVIESKNPSDYIPNLTSFARKGTGLTIGVGFLMANAIYQVAKEYPKQKFALIDGAPADAKGNTRNLSNVANLFFKEQESGYLVGAIAGLMEKDKVGKAVHNTIGCMGGLPIPPVNRYIAGYYAGARHVNPGIKIVRGYSQSFVNQQAGKSIGLAQIDTSHADILFQVAGASGLGYLAAAQQRGVYGIGADADQGYLGKYIIASAIKRVEIAVRDTIRATQTGAFKGGDHLFSLKNDGTGFVATGGTVPSKIVSQVHALERQIASGKIVPPATPPSS
ncbi:MAG: BMP family ABC transporter substrate-binding protein [Chloroflexi bacterium]|nr:BMP family ABC transporter substrate-binding protein [Chloroflexota bacterium]